MNFPHRLLLLSAASALASVLVAQTRPAASASPPEALIAVQLDEFQVIRERNPTCRATNATAGTRPGTKIKDLPQSITVLTEDFLPDIGAIKLVPDDLVRRGQTGTVNHRLLAGCELSRDRVRNDV